METHYGSTLRPIPFSREQVYGSLSDFDHLGHLKDSLNDDRLQGVRFSGDTLSFEAPMVGAVQLRVVERREPEQIRLKSENSPLPFTFEINLTADGASSCSLQLGLAADLNPFVRGVVGGKLQQALEKMADMLAVLDYGKLSSRS